MSLNFGPLAQRSAGNSIRPPQNFWDWLNRFALPRISRSIRAAAIVLWRLALLLTPIAWAWLATGLPVLLSTIGPLIKSIGVGGRQAARWFHRWIGANLVAIFIILTCLLTMGLQFFHVDPRQLEVIPDVTVSDGTITFSLHRMSVPTAAANNPVEPPAPLATELVVMPAPNQVVVAPSATAVPVTLTLVPPTGTPVPPTKTITATSTPTITASATATATVTSTPTPLPGIGAQVGTAELGIVLTRVDFRQRGDTSQTDPAAIEGIVAFTNNWANPMTVQLDLSSVRAMDNKGRVYIDYYEDNRRHYLGQSGYKGIPIVIGSVDWPSYIQPVFTIAPGQTVRRNFDLTRQFTGWNGTSRVELDTDWIRWEFGEITYRTQQGHTLDDIVWLVQRG